MQGNQMCQSHNVKQLQMICVHCEIDEVISIKLPKP